MKTEFSAGGIVYRKIEDKVVLAMIKDSYDQWTFPKGHIEKGEETEQAAVREIEEETGLNDLVIIELLEKIDYWFKINDETIHKYVYFYLMESKIGELKPQLTEVKEVKWFSPQEALEITGYKNEIPALIRKACQKLAINLE